MKKSIALFFAVLLCFALPVEAWAEGFAVPDSVTVTAASVYILNVDTGLPVVEKNSRERRDIASLTKMMTCLLLVENVADLDGTLVTAPTSIYVSPVTDYSASTADIRPGETVTARSLLYGMLLPSGNEAAAVTAYYLGKENVENFYAMMNARAKELGCLDTNFTNPHGLLGMDNGNYSTAYDLALIAQACWQNEAIRTAASAQSYDMPFTNIHTKAQNAANPNAAYTIYNTNRMLQPTAPVYRDYIKGLKTGSTHAAGRTFAGIAVNSRGETYVGVFLGAPWDPAPDGYAYSFHDTMNLFDWIFANFAVQPSLDTTVPVHELPVELSSDTDIVKLLPTQDMKTILPLEGGADLVERSFDVPESVNAPIKAGDKLGTLTLSLQGKVIGVVDLVAAYDVERNPLLNVLYAIGEFFKGTYFRVVLILTGIYIVLYFSVMLWLRTNQRKRRLAMQRRAANLGAAPADSRALYGRPGGAGAYGASDSFGAYGAMAGMDDPDDSDFAGAQRAPAGRAAKGGLLGLFAPKRRRGAARKTTRGAQAPAAQAQRDGRASADRTAQGTMTYDRTGRSAGQSVPPARGSARSTGQFSTPTGTAPRSTGQFSAPRQGQSGTPMPQNRRPRT